MKNAYGGIDIGKHGSFACRIDLEDRSVRYPERSLGVNELLDWFESNSVDGICIDGPPQPNQGRLAQRLPADTRFNTQRRVAEFALKIYGCYGTPAQIPDINSNQGWMTRSMEVFGALRDHFRWGIDLGDGNGELSETHPTYAFKSMLGRVQRETHGDIIQWGVDPENRLAPKRPSNAGGHAQRIELIRQSFEEINLQFDVAVQAYLWASIDHVDATLCALMALWKGKARKELVPVGDPAEGSIYMPTCNGEFKVTPRDSDAHRQPPTRIEVGAGRGSCRKACNAVILKLGHNGPGGLSQEETIELAIAAFGEGDRWLPVGTGHRFNLCENLEQVGRVLYLAFGNTLRIRILTGECIRQSEPNLPYPGEFNPWPVAETYGWVEMSEVMKVEIREFQTRHKGCWCQGLSNRGANLRYARVHDERGDAQ